MDQKDMPLNVFKGLLERFKEGTPIHLQGEGETLLWPHLDDVLIEYSKKYMDSSILGIIDDSNQYRGSCKSA